MTREAGEASGQENKDFEVLDYETDDAKGGRGSRRETPRAVRGWVEKNQPA